MKTLKEHKAEYRSSMKAFLGDNWKRLSERMKVYNVPPNIVQREQIKQSV